MLNLLGFYYVCIIPYTVNCNWWILKDSLPIGKNSFYKVLLNLLQIFYCFSFFLQVLSLTVNILRTIFLKSESGHWSEMILLLQVGQTRTNIYKSDLKVSCLWTKRKDLAGSKSAPLVIEFTTINTQGHVSYTELLAQNGFFFWYFIISVPEKKLQLHHLKFISFLIDININ